MQITRIDPTDERALADWHAAADKGLNAGRSHPLYWSLPEVRVTLTHDDGAYEREAYAALDGGEVVGTAMIEMPVRDNLTLAEIELAVVPEHRRRGVGTAMLSAVTARASERGRTSLIAAVQQPADAPEAPGVPFATAHGFTKRNTELRRILELPLPDGLLDRLEAKAADRLGEYRLRTWADAAPDELAEQYAHLKSLLMSEAPTGDMDLEPQVWDVERLRGEEAATAAQGRSVVTTVAVAPDGKLAGHTQIGIPLDDPTLRVFQWDTLVLPEHRGHRLGLAVKAANLRALAERYPDRSRVETWNAVQNGPMVSVNEELGFRAVEEYQEWQRG